MTMKLYAAIDLHSNNNVLVILDENDRVILERRLRNDIQAVLAHLAPYRERIVAIAVESTYNWSLEEVRAPACGLSVGVFAAVPDLNSVLDRVTSSRIFARCHPPRRACPPRLGAP